MRAVFRRFVSIIAFVLAVGWLPAAQHCEIEAIGWLSETAAADDSCCTPAAGCAQDACDVVEKGGYQPSASTAKVPAPVLLALACGLIPTWINPPLALDEAVVDQHSDEPLRWVPSWQFVRRAAPLPRAPSA